MSLITGSIKSILSIKIKHRHDSYSDQVSRIFVAKMFMVASLIIGVDWFHDTVFCVLPHGSTMQEDFVQSACWIQGFYIYPQMENLMNQSAYFGIPLYVTANGIINGTNHLCKTHDKWNKVNKYCIPMEKYYFAHYQWMPFYVASLALFFYLPYVLFRIVNTDIISLQGHLQHSKIYTKDIVENYFNHKINSKMKMRFRVLFNLIIKCLYVIVNVFAFKVLDILLSDQFENYGINWTRWLSLNSSMAMDFSRRTEPTPGNKMLPTFGYCDVHELAQDGYTSTDNKNKILCEISSNILYQYVLMVLWFVLVFSIVISILGIFENIFTHVISAVCTVKRDRTAKHVYRYLTFRECEYLEYIRHKNLAVFGNVVRAIMARNSILKNMLPQQFVMGTTYTGKDVSDGLNGECVTLKKAPQENEIVGVDCDPDELNYFRKTPHQMTKMAFKDRSKHEKQYGLLDDILSGGL